ncbi:MAG: FMN-binding protein [Lachnospiraceae bacterium]|nr:FMN-binding protein [Lachnospiraceae bacterium]
MTAYFVDFENYQNKIREIHIQNIDVSQVEDGIYVGEYDAGYIYAKVEVVVKNGVITELNILEHDNERGKAAEVITDKMVEEQKIDVDAVTNATNSSKVIKMAVQSALLK